MAFKLNIGSSRPRGIYRNPPWVCLDMTRERGRNFVSGDGTQMPFRDASVDEIHCVHMLEHVERRAHTLFYREMHRVLVPGGFALIEVPDFLGTCELIREAAKKTLETSGREQGVWQERLRCWRLSVYGKGRHKHDIHRWGFTLSDLAQDAMEHGFHISKESNHISTHWKQEPVLLVRFTKP